MAMATHDYQVDMIQAILLSAQIVVSGSVRASAQPLGACGLLCRLDCTGPPVSVCSTISISPPAVHREGYKKSHHTIT